MKPSTRRAGRWVVLALALVALSTALTAAAALAGAASVPGGRTAAGRSLPSGAAPVVHPRHLGFGLSGHLHALGSVQVSDGYFECAAFKAVKVQRRAGTRWTTVTVVYTSAPLPPADSFWKAKLPDRAGSYRTVAERQRVRGSEHVCARAVSPVVVHRHPKR